MINNYILCISILSIIVAFSQLSVATRTASVTGIAAISFTDVKGLNDGTFTITGGEDVKLRLFGSNLDEVKSIVVTNNDKTCRIHESTVLSADAFHFYPINIFPGENSTSEMLTVVANLPEAETPYYFCLRYFNDSLVHQGLNPWRTIKAGPKYIMPLWLQILFVVVLLCLSSMFSGLNLGLMALDKTELQIVIQSGSPKEREYAKKIQPVRNRGNFLLCTLLLGNVLVNATLTVLLDNIIGSGAWAIVGSTLGIVVFGEIVPQSICSRHGLMVGAMTIPLTYLFMVITCPLSYPISRLLDLILGEEIGTYYNRERLKELLYVTQRHTDLEKPEMNIITGVLEMSKKTARDIMTPISDVYMITIDQVLDFNTISDIHNSGYTRIPVRDATDKNAILAILNTKDLALIDPADNIPVKTIVETYNRRVKWTHADETLEKLLETFKSGQSHISIVHEINSDGVGDPYYEVIGIVTLEDVLEEILQAEIIDETDMVYDNRKKQKIQRPGLSKRPKFLMGTEEHQLSSRLAVAAFQFLSTMVPPFKPDMISPAVLRRLLQQNILVIHRFKDSSPTKGSSCIYEFGKPADYFVLILEGRVLVESGKEGLLFEVGPFHFFGVQTLERAAKVVDSHGTPSSVRNSRNALDDYRKVVKSEVFWAPDYTVKPCSDLQYIRILRAQYLAALRATAIERSLPDSTTRSTSKVNVMPPSLQIERPSHRTKTEILIEDIFTKEWNRAKQVSDVAPPMTTTVGGGGGSSNAPSIISGGGLLPNTTTTTITNDNIPAGTNISMSSFSSQQQQQNQNPNAIIKGDTDETEDESKSVEIDASSPLLGKNNAKLTSASSPTSSHPPKNYEGVAVTSNNIAGAHHLFSPPTSTFAPFTNTERNLPPSNPPTASSLRSTDDSSSEASLLKEMMMIPNDTTNATPGSNLMSSHLLADQHRTDPSSVELPPLRHQQQGKRRHQQHNDNKEYDVDTITFNNRNNHDGGVSS